MLRRINYLPTNQNRLVGVDFNCRQLGDHSISHLCIMNDVRGSTSKFIIFEERTYI